MILLLAAVAGALACTGEREGKVVGWTPDGKQVLLRVQEDNGEGPILYLRLYDVGQREPAREWTILDVGEGAEERATKWKAAEAELKDLGVTVVGDAQPVSLAEASPGAGIRLTSLTLRRDYVSRTRILASSGERSVLLENEVAACCFGGNGVSSDGPWVLPGRDWLVYVTNGCMGGSPVFIDLGDALHHLVDEGG